jgi:tellurite resistance protein
MAVRMPRIGAVPVALFGIVLGLSGLGGGWRLASRLWGAPPWIGEIVLAAAATVWLLLVLLYCAKWLIARPQALAEARHPVACCFIGLVFVSTMLIANASLRYSAGFGLALGSVGLLGHVLFSVWRTGQLWKGNREVGSTTAVLYLPSVAGNFVGATLSANLGFPQLGSLLFGAGLFSWLAIESVLLHRLYTAEPLPAPIRPTLGIQLAPPAVGCIAYLAVQGGPPGLFAMALVGYAVFQAVILIRLLPWFAQNAFAPGYWAFSFGATAMAGAIIELAERGAGGLIAALAGPVFAVTNLFIAFLVVRTLVLLSSGRLIPAT